MVRVQPGEFRPAWACGNGLKLWVRCVSEVGKERALPWPADRRCRWLPTNPRATSARSSSRRCGRRWKRPPGCTIVLCPASFGLPSVRTCPPTPRPRRLLLPAISRPRGRRHREQRRRQRDRLLRGATPRPCGVREARGAGAGRGRTGSGTRDPHRPGRGTPAERGLDEACPGRSIAAFDDEARLVEGAADADAYEEAGVSVVGRAEAVRPAGRRSASRQRRLPLNRELVQGGRAVWSRDRRLSLRAPTSRLVRRRGLYRLGTGAELAARPPLRVARQPSRCPR